MFLKRKIACLLVLITTILATFTNNYVLLNAENLVDTLTILIVDDIFKEEPIDKSRFQITEIECERSSKNKNTYLLNFRLYCDYFDSQIDYKDAILEIELKDGMVIEYKIAECAFGFDKNTRWASLLNIKIGQFALPCSFNQVVKMRLKDLMFYETPQDVFDDTYIMLDLEIYQLENWD